MKSTTANNRGQPALGIALKLWLVFVCLAGFWTAYRFGTIIEDLVDHHDPRWTGAMVWALPALAGLSLLNALFAVLLFFRLKLGFHLFLLGFVISVVIALILNIPLISLLPGLVGLAVLAFLVGRNREALR